MVSLAPFADENPDHFLVFTFIESREDEPFDEEYDNRIVLGEYELTTDQGTPDYPDDAVMLKKYELPPGVKMPRN